MPTTMAAAELQTQASFSLKHRSAGITLFQPLSASLDRITEQLQLQRGQAPALFADLTLVIDASLWPPSLNLADLISRLSEQQLKPMALSGADQPLQQQAAALGLPTIDVAAPRSANSHTAASLRPLVVSQPVRSGQKIVARGRDLILLNSVSNGAEVVSDGHIHCCGVLRGKAYVGASGDQSAQLFCQKLDAELVAVAGLYQLHGEWPVQMRNQPVRVAFDNEKLIFTPL